MDSYEKNFEVIILEDVLNALRDILAQHNFCLEVKTNWPLVQKTYSEVGGRFIEDFFLQYCPQIVAEKNKQRLHFYNIINAYPPTGRRTIEDIVFEWFVPTKIKSKQTILLSLKGHQKDVPSYPNLASLQKTVSFYSNASNMNKHIIVAYCTFVAEPIQFNGRYNGFIMRFTREGVQGFHLKNISEENIGFGDIGGGHQIMLRNPQEIKTVYRTRAEFIQLIMAKADLWKKELLKKRDRIREKRAIYKS